jgi:NitT/TauT family transport system substrate-binding protein
MGRLRLSDRDSRPMRVSRLLVVVTGIVLASSGCGGAARTPVGLRQVVLQHFWTHGTLFAGFYVADQNEYYAEEGLSVQMVEGGVGVDYLTPVAEGAADFGYAGADELIVARAAGLPVRAIATIYRRSPSVLVALADSGITRPQDFIGRTIRVAPQTATHFHALMARIGIDSSQYTEVVLPSDLDLFASGQAQVWNIYLNNFGVDLERAGYELNYVYPDDYGVHFYADTLFTNDTLVANDPDLVLRFVRATLRGWTWAVENPNAVGTVVQHYAPAADAGLESEKMSAAVPLINTGEDYIGWMKPEVWGGMEQTLRQQGVLTTAVNVDDVFTLRFLQAIYPP